MQQKRILMVSNRLPITVREHEGQVSISPSSGGLATGLGSFYRDFGVSWLGWPGSVIPRNRSRVESQLRSEFNCEPVFLSDRLVERYYEGYSNRTIWPLFHSFQTYAKFSSLEWEAYQEANEKFLLALEKVIKPGDHIWIHDYQLLLLPGMIRQKYPQASVGFFLHIPFPSYDILRLLPQHKAIMRSLIAADLIGFHTHDYMQAFLESSRRLFGLESYQGQFVVGDRAVSAGVFPMGIDFEKFSTSAHALEGTEADDETKRSIGDAKVIFSVSRLDYTKGVPHGLDAFEALLEAHPELKGKVVYLLSVVPSREKVERYASLKREIDEAVGAINSKFGTLDWTPIRYIYRNLSFNELISLYKNSHVAFVTPLRDGMNLIAKEYVAARVDDRGVLVLSEMAGAAKELVEALTVNPNSREDMADALFQALTMPEEEQMRRMQAMRQKCSESHVKRWAESFTQRLFEGTHATELLKAKQLVGENREALLAKMARSRKRLFLIDYDGTMMPFMMDPRSVRPDAEVLELLTSLSLDSRNHVVLLSGRDKDTLGRWLGHLPISLIAEHGGWTRFQGAQSWTAGYQGMETSWKAEIRPILNSYVENIPGSFVEEKNYSLVWHYRKSDAESAASAAKDLLHTLVALVGTLGVQVLPGKKILEVRNIGVGKARVFARSFEDKDYDFIFAGGDDVTDEELFAVLPKEAVSVKVGRGFSRAAYQVHSVSDFRDLLRSFCKLGEASTSSSLTSAPAGHSDPKTAEA